MTSLRLINKKITWNEKDQKANRKIMEALNVTGIVKNALKYNPRVIERKLDVYFSRIAVRKINSRRA